MDDVADFQWPRLKPDLTPTGGSRVAKAAGRSSTRSRAPGTASILRASVVETMALPMHGFDDLEPGAAPNCRAPPRRPRPQDAASSRDGEIDPGPASARTRWRRPPTSLARVRVRLGKCRPILDEVSITPVDVRDVGEGPKKTTVRPSEGDLCGAGW